MLYGNFTLLVCICIAALFIFHFKYYPRNDLNVYGNVPAKLKFAPSTNSSTRICAATQTTCIFKNQITRFPLVNDIF